MMQRIFVIFFVIQVSWHCSNGLPIIPPEQAHPHKISERTLPSASKTWTDEPLCVLKMGSSCPSGFVEDQIKLSVQTDVNPRDTGRDGETLIMMGQAGESSLVRSTYDSLYTLTLTTCCRNN